jgi:hypothetical protein
MNDLDTQLLRRALRAPQEPGYPSAGYTGPADVAEIISRGRRLRWRRRAMAAGGSVCLAAAVVGAVAGIGRLTTPSPAPAQHVISPVGPGRTAPASRPSPDRGRATPEPVPSATAAPTTPGTPAATALPASTAPPTASATQPQSVPTPTPTRTTGASVSSASTPTATPTASASASVASTASGQPSPSATPSTTG